MEKLDPLICLELTNRLSELSRIQEALEANAERFGVPEAMIMSLNLAIEEAFTNIVNYAYTDQEQHTIGICISRKEKALTITLTDDGKPYDPTQKDDPDIELPAEKRQVGGLGIFLIRKIMDKVEYERIDNKNNLILTKNISK
jgi:serine/threonine-protein kinase RsbW